MERETDVIGRKKGSASTVAGLLKLVEGSLDEDKAQDVVAIDLSGKSTIADYMVIASGRSQRQVGAMADHLCKRLKGTLPESPRVEGLRQGDWVLIDAGDVVIHLFRPEVRSFYNLEKLWSVRLPPSEQAAV